MITESLQIQRLNYPHSLMNLLFMLYSKDFEFVVLVFIYSYLLMLKIYTYYKHCLPYNYILVK